LGGKISRAGKVFKKSTANQVVWASNREKGSERRVEKRSRGGGIKMIGDELEVN